MGRIRATKLLKEMLKGKMKDMNSFIMLKLHQRIQEALGTDYDSIRAEIEKKIEANRKEVRRIEKKIEQLEKQGFTASAEEYYEDLIALEEK